MSYVDKLEKKINRQFASEGLGIRDVTYVKGFWKSADCWRWEGFMFSLTNPAVIRFVGSFYTITECLRRGELELIEDEFFLKETP